MYESESNISNIGQLDGNNTRNSDSDNYNNVSYVPNCATLPPPYANIKPDKIIDKVSLPTVANFNLICLSKNREPYNGHFGKTVRCLILG